MQMPGCFVPLKTDQTIKLCEKPHSPVKKVFFRLAGALCTTGSKSTDQNKSTLRTSLTPTKQNLPTL